MKTIICPYLLLVLSLLPLSSSIAQVKSKSDTIKVENGDRNIMLNAESANTGPRNVNIGLPAGLSTTVLENDLPVVYFPWPEMSFKSWRQDATINNTKLLDIGQTAIAIGEVGYSVSSYDNLGTDLFRGNLNLNSNHYGLINGTANISGPIKNGWKYSVGGFINLDPGFYSARANDIDRYYSDDTKLFKAAITKDYSFGSSTGSLSVLYKYMDSKTIRLQYAPFIYHLDGSVSEIDGFRIGRDNYMLSQKFNVRDAETGEIVERDAFKDFGSTTHTFYLLGKNSFNSGYNLKYNLMYHSSKTGNYTPVMTGINTEGTVQNVMLLGSKKTPLKTFAGLVELNKKFGDHQLKLGINHFYYNVDRFITEGVRFSQTVDVNPTFIEGSEMYGNYEYHNGSENETAINLTDNWKVSDNFTLNAGMRFKYVNLDGDYIDNAVNAGSTLPYLSREKTNINKSWFGKTFMLSGIFNLNRNFGLLVDASYNELYGHLENYSAGNEPNIRTSTIPSAALGFFFNHPVISVVSKATYITRDEYRSTFNFTSASGDVLRSMVSYDIETFGWTTDILTTPFKNFNLHFLVTLQAPKYKNYSGTLNFETGESAEYDYNDKTVTGVPTVLLEIDPSYQWNNLRLWTSARYFSKTYANLPNTLNFKGRWETFAGVNYSLNKNLDFNLTFVNLLNQRGASGSIPGSDLFSEEDVRNMEGRIMAGRYIRPFTMEFGMKLGF